MTTFKAGDKAYHILRGEWVSLKKSSITSECLVDELGTQYYFDGRMHNTHKYPVLLDHEPESHKWKPKAGDLCWFWQFENIRAWSVSEFDKMLGGKFLSKGGQDWNFCAPFEGSLPKGVEL